MRGIAVASVVLSIVVVQAWSPVNSQEIASVQDEIDPSLVRPFWLGGGAVPAAPPYTLTPQDRELYGGAFGIDLSHYSFDIDPSSSKCKTQEGYDQPACSCTADLDVLARNKLLYLYTKASDGAGIDLSFARLVTIRAEAGIQNAFQGRLPLLPPWGRPRRSGQYVSAPDRRS